MWFFPLISELDREHPTILFTISTIIRTTTTTMKEDHQPQKQKTVRIKCILMHSKLEHFYYKNKSMKFTFIVYSLAGLITRSLLLFLTIHERRRRPPCVISLRLKITASIKMNELFLKLHQLHSAVNFI